MILILLLLFLKKQMQNIHKKNMTCLNCRNGTLAWWNFSTKFNIPLIKRSVQTSVLLCVANTHRHTEPTCVWRKGKKKKKHHFNSTNWQQKKWTSNCWLNLPQLAPWVTRVGYRPPEQWLPNSLCQKIKWGLCNQDLGRIHYNEEIKKKVLN